MTKNAISFTTWMVFISWLTTYAIGEETKPKPRQLTAEEIAKLTAPA